MQAPHVSPTVLTTAAIEGAPQCLRECIDLIAVATSGKCRDLTAEVTEPRGPAGQPDRSRLDAGGLLIHSAHLIGHRIDPNREDASSFHFLPEGHARAILLKPK